MNNFKKHLTPIDTEEIKPNLFIKKTDKGYRQVHPLVWNNKYRWKEQLKTVFTFRTFFTLALIIFIAWSYVHDTKECFDVLEKIGLLCKDNNLICVTYGFTDEESSLGERGMYEDTNNLSIFNRED